MKKSIQSFCILLLITSYAIAQPTSFNSKGIGGGGALFSPSINPGNNNEYYIACDMGQFFHSTDFGNSYSQLDFREIMAGHYSKVCFTSTPGLLYSLNYANNTIAPVKSIDNGVTWEELPGDPRASDEIFSLNADYHNPNRLIFSYYSNIYFSNDGGATFTDIHSALSGSGIIVGGVFFDANNIYIGTNDGVLISTDGGNNWQIANITGIPATEAIWSFTGAKVGSTTRFFCMTANADEMYAGLVGSDYYDFMKGVYSVDYGTGSWTTKTTGITQGTDFPMFIAMAANDTNTVYLAGSNNNSEPIILKTDNAGSTWSHSFITINNENINTGWSGDGGDRTWGYGESPFGISVALNNSSKVIFGDYGFVHKTSDGGNTWQQAYVDTAYQNTADTTITPKKNYKSVGIENTTCWHLHWMNADTLWASFSDIRGIKSTNAGDAWSFDYTGHTGNSSYRVVQHPSNGTLYAATSDIHDIYQSTHLQDARLDAFDNHGKIIYSTDKGTTWQDLHVFNHPVFWMTLDPNNPNIAYASVIHYDEGNGIGGIYRTTDLNNLENAVWTLLPNPPRTEKHPASIVVLNDGKMVCTYSGRRTGNFTASSGVFMYNQSNNSWTDLSIPAMHYWTKDIVIDPNNLNQNTWYVGVFSGWGGLADDLGGLYKTTDRGANWVKLTDQSLIDRVTSCTFNPNNKDEIYLTTEGAGLWMSQNINDSAPTFSPVTNYPFHQPERVFFNPYKTNELWVTSFGNGMKMGTLLTTGVIDFSYGNKLFIYPNPSNGFINLLNESKTPTAIIYDVLGNKVTTLGIQQGVNQLDLTSFAAGIYFIQVDNRTTKIILSN